MFPKQLEGSLVGSKGETLGAIQRRYGWCGIGSGRGHTPYPERGSKGAKALARLIKMPLFGVLKSGLWEP